MQWNPPRDMLALIDITWWVGFCQQAIDPKNLLNYQVCQKLFLGKIFSLHLKLDYLIHRDRAHSGKPIFQIIDHLYEMYCNTLYRQFSWVALVFLAYLDGGSPLKRKQSSHLALSWWHWLWMMLGVVLPIQHSFTLLWLFHRSLP